MTIAEKLVKVVENVPKVYEAGKSDLTWEITNLITVDNTRVHFHNAFAYTSWDNFQFAYPIKPLGNIAQMFYGSSMTKLPKPLDFSEIMTKPSSNSYTYRRGVFGYCSKLKEIDFSAETGINMRAIDGVEEWFQGCRNLETIKGLNVHEGTIFNTASGSSAFYLCDALVNISFAEGSVIGNSFDIHWSTKLSTESLYNIITALSSSVSGQKLTVPPTAEATYNANPPQGGGIPQTWVELIGTKSNWTVAES